MEWNNEEKDWMCVCVWGAGGGGGGGLLPGSLAEKIRAEWWWKRI